jgi:hypothetical protein
MFVHGSDIESNCKYDIGMMSRRAFMQAGPLALENHQRKRTLKQEALHCHDGYDKKELEKLADNIKQAMFQDYKVAYSEEGDAHKEEAESTITVG